MEQAETLLQAAVARGTGPALDAWAGSGAEGVRLLYAILTGARQPPWRGLHPRDEIDNLDAATAALAAARPTEFLDVFDPQWDTNTFVLAGLGRIGHPRATERLVLAAQSDDEWARMSAAIGLGGRSSRDATAALVRQLGDDAYLVRYHALQGLGATADPDALPPLLAFAAPTDIERRLADRAIASIESKSGRPPAGNIGSP